MTKYFVAKVKEKTMAKNGFFMVMLGLILASAVPVSIYAQNLPDNVVVQVQVKYYSVSVSGSYKSADGRASYVTSRMYSIRASSSSEAREEALMRFYSEFPSAYNVRTNVLN
jgi:hypothetical protein